jgi:hypothetical protein
MRILALFSTLVFLPFAAWAGQVQNSSLTLPYDTTQDLADVVKIFTDSYDAYRSVSIRVAFGPLIELVTRTLQDVRVWSRRGRTIEQDCFGPTERVGRHHSRRVVHNGMSPALVERMLLIHDSFQQIMGLTVGQHP